jgi:transcriptional regulator with PAS, ATPase and Fis domain
MENKVNLGLAIIDNSLLIKSINEQFSIILQADSSSLIGTNLKSFFPEIEPSILSGKKHYLIKTISKDNLFVDLYFTLIDDSSNEYLVLCSKYLVFDDLIKNEQYLNKQFQISRQIFDKFTDGIYICDALGQTIYYNDSFNILSGLTAEMLSETKNIYNSIKSGLIPNSCVGIVINTKAPASSIIKYPLGKKCLVSAYPIDVNSDLYAVAIVRDLTELNLLQNQLEIQKELTDAYKSKLKEYQDKDSISNVIINNNNVMCKLYEYIFQVSTLDCPVFLQGETGVGKDFLAKLIHDTGRSNEDGCFIKVNCGAIPENLLESELFGYEKGAFTGADNRGKVGLFQLAKNGTIFLDEIGDMPLNMQVKLLTSIEDKQFYRVGGTKLIKLNARIIAATNKDIKGLINEGKFRLDLYYRLNLVTINIPPLRERKEDIIPLALKFLEDFNKKYKKSCYFSSDAITSLYNYSWPGNVREVKNVIEKAVIMSQYDCINDDFKIKTSKNENYKSDISPQSSDNNFTLKEKMEFYEASLIKERIRSHKSLQETADSLGIDLSTLVRKKRKYKISIK